MSSANNTTDLRDLADQFALKDHLSFEPGPGNLPIACIRNKHATASIALNGAQVLSYQPHNEAPVLWLSQTALFEPGKAIRGGIPLCWPWFAHHPHDRDKPAHGFARTASWSVDHLEVTADESTRLFLTLGDSPQTLSLWPHAFSFTAIITVGRLLDVQLVTQNRSQTNMICSGALHSYFHLADAARTQITGLENARYIDKLSDMSISTQDQPLRVNQAMDRIYFDTVSDCIIHDDNQQRQIRISKQGSHSTVVWNPGKEAAAGMNDFDDNGYENMVCVETANAAPDSVSIKPGDSHTLQTTIGTQPLQ